MLVGTDVCVRVVFLFEETEVPGGNPPVRLGDHMIYLTCDAGYQTLLNIIISLHPYRVLKEPHTDYSKK